MANFPVHGYGVPQILSQWQSGQNRRQQNEQFNSALDLKTQQFEQQQTEFKQQTDDKKNLRVVEASKNAFKFVDLGDKYIKGGNPALGLELNKKGYGMLNQIHPDLNIDLSKVVDPTKIKEEADKQILTGVTDLYNRAKTGDQEAISKMPGALAAASYSGIDETALKFFSDYAPTGEMTDEQKNEAKVLAAKTSLEGQKELKEIPQATAPKIYSDTAQLNADFKAGLLTQEQYDAEIENLTKEGDKGYAPLKLTKLFNKMDELPEDDPRRDAYQAEIDKLTRGGDPDLERVLAERIVDGKLDFNKLSRRGKQKGRVAAIIAEIAPDFSLIDAEANIKYKTDSANLRSIALIAGIEPLYEKLSTKATELGNTTLPIFNKGVNFYKLQTGDEKIVAFNNLRDDVIAETERVLLGTGVLSDSKYLRALGNLNSAQSPKQMGAAIRQMMMVVDKRGEALKTQPYPQGGNKPGENGSTDPEMEGFWE